MVAVIPYLRRTAWGPNEAMLEALRSALPDVEIVPHGDVPADRVDDITVAIVDGPDPSQLADLPNLTWVQSMWAGVEALLAELPPHIEIARMLDPQLGATMAEAVLAWVLYLHRDMPRYARQQDHREWQVHAPVRASERSIGILGLGELGRVAAAVVGGQGFPVAGWSRSAKSIDGVECFAGDDGLRRLLERSDIVVNLLPHTGATAGLIDRRAFAAMPAGASIINFGRGQTIDDDALLAALDSGHLDHAVLDVFAVEPLPSEHRFWGHPSVTVLPHISGPTSVDTAAHIAAENVRRYLRTGALPAGALVDRTRGY